MSPTWIPPLNSIPMGPAVHLIPQFRSLWNITDSTWSKPNSWYYFWKLLSPPTSQIQLRLFSPLHLLRQKKLWSHLWLFLFFLTPSTSENLGDSTLKNKTKPTRIQALVFHLCSHHSGPHSLFFTLQPEISCLGQNRITPFSAPNFS